MAFVKFLLVLIEVMSSLLLLGAILIQKSRGYGIGTALGGMGETVFGAHMGTVLTKATVVLSIIFLVNTALLAIVGGRLQTSTSVTEQVGGAPAAQPQPAQQPTAPITGNAGPVQPLAPGSAVPATPSDVVPSASPLSVPAPAPAP